MNAVISVAHGGVGLQHVTKTVFENTYVPLPPLAEQRRIVAATESALAVIEEIERGKADLQSAAAAVKSKILSLAIRGKLVPQDENDEPAGVLLERVRAEKERLAKAGKTKRGKGENAAPVSAHNSYYDNLPAGWAWARLGELGTTHIGLTYNPEKEVVPIVQTDFSGFLACLFPYQAAFKKPALYRESGVFPPREAWGRIWL